ncbi:hypothetical protein D3C73_173290 [compost metagenome]
MESDTDFALKNWKSSKLIKKQVRHLKEEPLYAKEDPEAKAELFKFCYAVRAKLREIQEKPLEERPALLEEFRKDYKLTISTQDFMRYDVDVHEYTLGMIMDIPNPEEVE